MIAAVYAALGDPTNALEWLEKAVNEKSAGVTYVKVFSPFDSLRESPRFAELCDRIGLAPSVRIDLPEP